MRIALFIPCFVDTLFPSAGRAMVEVLERLGHELELPPGQTCCGQIHVNSGYRGEATGLARRFVEVFRRSEAVVAPSASCVGLVHDVYPDLARESGDRALIDDVEALLPRVHEFSQFVADVQGVADVGAYFPHRVTLHTSCHSLRVLHVGDAPQRLLANVRGIEVVDLPHADECCGFGGTFAVKNAKTSEAMLASKVAHVLGTGAEFVVAADNSCLMNIGGALSRQRAGVRTLHLAEVLASTEARPWAASWGAS